MVTGKYLHTFQQLSLCSMIVPKPQENGLCMSPVMSNSRCLFCFSCSLHLDCILQLPPAQHLCTLAPVLLATLIQQAWNNCCPPMTKTTQSSVPKGKELGSCQQLVLMDETSPVQQASEDMSLARTESLAFIQSSRSSQPSSAHCRIILKLHHRLFGNVHCNA